MAKKAARIISILFHPVLIPTFGFLLLLYSGFYFSNISWEAKRIVLIIIFFSTGILPMLGIAMLAFSSGIEQKIKSGSSRIISLIISSISYYSGYLLLNRIHAFPVFKVILIASVLACTALLLLSLKWNISSHMTSMGGISGAILALSFRTGLNPVWSVVTVILISGVVATARIILEKNKYWQLSSGYALGFIILYLVIYFV